MTVMKIGNVWAVYKGSAKIVESNNIDVALMYQDGLMNALKFWSDFEDVANCSFCSRYLVHNDGLGVELSSESGKMFKEYIAIVKCLDAMINSRSHSSICSRNGVMILCYDCYSKYVESVKLIKSISE